MPATSHLENTLKKSATLPQRRQPCWQGRTALYQQIKAVTRQTTCTVLSHDPRSPPEVGAAAKHIQVGAGARGSARLQLGVAANLLGARHHPDLQHAPAFADQAGSVAAGRIATERGCSLSCSMARQLLQVHVRGGRPPARPGTLRASRPRPAAAAGAPRPPLQQPRAGC